MEKNTFPHRVSCGCSPDKQAGVSYKKVNRDGVLCRCCSAVIIKLMVFADNTYGAAVGDFSVERGHLEDRGLQQL